MLVVTSLSYWERKSWFEDIDVCVVGSGIVGLSCALAMRKARPQSKILVLERGPLPSGGSSKNAGFACFGSISEVVSDLQHHEEQEVFELVRARAQGIDLLLGTLGQEAIGYHRFGGREIFLHHQRELFERCVEEIPRVNQLLAPHFGGEVYCVQDDPFAFAGVLPQCVYSPYEGQIDTGQMMLALLAKCSEARIMVLNGVTVQDFEESSSAVTLKCEHFECSTAKLAIATNGFAAKLIEEEVQPARAQALITSEIPDLRLKGTFHLDRGYYYFRNLGQRVLLGGGRNLDIEGERTYDFGTTEMIQSKLDELLAQVILPGQRFEVEHRWSGIMGVGAQKLPIVKKLSDRSVCGVRMSGMGVALGSFVGAQMAHLLGD